MLSVCVLVGHIHFDQPQFCNCPWLCYAGQRVIHRKTGRQQLGYQKERKRYGFLDGFIPRHTPADTGKRLKAKNIKFFFFAGENLQNQGFEVFGR